MNPTVQTLWLATRDAYHELANGADSETTYAALTATFAEFGLDADVAESAVDWYENGPRLLSEELADCLSNIPQQKGARG